MNHHFVGIIHFASKGVSWLDYWNTHCGAQKTT